MKITNVNIIHIKPYAQNTKKHPETQIKNIAESIKQFGFIQPIVLDNNNEIIIGHGRYFASQLLGYEEIPCVFVENLSEEQVRKLRILDNKLNESEWDDDLLRLELEDLDFGDFDVDFGLDFEEEEKEIIEDEAPEVDEEAEPICKLGDIWQLGRHRLMCGDSTKQEDVAKLMNGNKADLLITDPPYNVEIVGGNHSESPNERKKKGNKTIKNDKMDNDSFYVFLFDAFTNAYNELKDGASFYCWYASKEVVNFHTSIESSGFSVKQELIWNKNSLVMGRQDYQWKHEPCLYGWKETNSHIWYGDRKQTTVIDWDRPTKSELHPTMKPVGLFDYQIKNSSKVGDIILDLFGGSGTTIMACEQNNRKAYVIEFDPKYCDVIIKRWENLTGKKAVKIN
jgi:site-specific DNA-methyltransferase (adenine-specific)